MDRLDNGANLGAYRILHQIGEGGMAKVYKAFQANMERYVALKVLPGHYAEEPQFIKRFIREARTIARLEHKNILPVYDFGEYNGITYLVMRYLEGGTLKDVLQQGRLTLHDTLEIMDQVCSALDYAHRQGVIHRDVKPSNVMIDAEGAAYLTDFGIAKVVGKSSDLTATGAAIGTPAYMAPEQAVGDKVDSRTDLYALGVVLYEMIVGRVPFRADTPVAVLMAHLHDPLPLPSEVDPQIHEAIETVIIKALAKEASDRYQRADDMLKALRQAIYAAAPESLETTLVNLISEIRASRSQAKTVQAGRASAEISDPHLLEKLEQLYIDGLSAYWIQDWEKAQIRLQEVVTFSPNYKDAAVRLADIEKQRRLADLHTQAEEAIEHTSWQAAQGYLREILSLVPNDASAKEKMALVEKKLELASLYAQGEQLFEAEQWQAVIKIFERIHQLEHDYPDPQNLHSQAIEALEEQHRLEKIKETYQKGLQALDQGNWKQAQKLFSQIQTQQPGYAETEQLLARATDELKRSKPTHKKRFYRIKPWHGIIALMVVVASVAGIWVLSSRSKPRPLESYTPATNTPDVDEIIPSAEDTKPTSEDELPPTEEDETPPTEIPLLPSEEIPEFIQDEITSSDSALDPAPWLIECEPEMQPGPDGLISEGRLSLTNTPSYDGTGCQLWAQNGERILGSEAGGIAATLYEAHSQGEMNSDTWISLLAEPEDGEVLHAFCGVQAWPDLHLALFGVFDFSDEVFYNDTEVDPEVPHDFRLEVDPNSMAIRCLVDEETLLGVWVPEDPDQLHQAEFARGIQISRLERVAGFSQVSNVQLLPPQHKSSAECPKITDWKAEYWDNADLAGDPILCRDESFPRHYWARSSPAPEIPSEWFSARYTKEMDFEGGRYAFRLSGDDGLRLWLNDELLINEWQDQSFAEYSAEVDIPAGMHTLRVEFFEHGDEAYLELFALHGDQLLFTDAPGCIQAPENLIGWWAGDGDATNQLGGEAGMLVNGASFVPGKINQAFRFDPTGWEQGTADAVEIPLSPEVDYLEVFTIEAWVYLDPENPLQGQVEDFVRVGRKFRLGEDGLGHLLFTIPYGSQNDYQLSGEVGLPRGEWVHVVGVYDGNEMRLFQNTELVGTAQVEGVSGGSPYFTLSNTAEPLSGMLDEVSLYDRALTIGEIRLLYYPGGSYGKCK